MRRSLATLAAGALLLSVVGGATGAEPAPSATPAPLVESTPEPTLPAGDPGGPLSSADLVASSPALAADPIGWAPAVDPNEPAPAVDPTDPALAAIVEPAANSGTANASAADRAAVDPTDRWIVVLKSGTDAAAAAGRQGRRIGFTTDRTFKNALRGYAAKLDRTKVAALRLDPSVAMIVADERIRAEGQVMPTGISRVSATLSPVAKIDGIDDRVDADVAIVDTGIATVADLNVAGGRNCSTPDPTLWRDVYGHGTHVAGTVAAIDNGSGVVGVAPGARLWAVKILNDSGDGLLSWYVCGLDWIAAQRDPLDPSRPMFEAVNMSVAKSGSDDGHCGTTNSDILHAAICRLVASGVTVVAAAANDSGSAAARVPAAYNEVITVSALADTDGKAGGLGGNKCFSWGTYDRDDTFADFSNYGSDVDLIAPGKCIWSTVPSGYAYSSGTSMAAPHVTGAVALLKASRPELTPSEVREALQYLGTLDWKTSTDPDPYHERLLEVSKIGRRGDFSVAVGHAATVSEAGGPADIPITISRSTTSFERIRLSVSGLPSGATATFAPTSLYGFIGVATTLTVIMPFAIGPGSYPVTVRADEHGNVRSTTATVDVVADTPIARPPATTTRAKAILGTTTIPTNLSWPAAADVSGIAAYEIQSSVDGAAWQPATTTSGTIRSFATSQVVGHGYRFRVRARDGVGTWSAWAEGPSATGALVQDRSSAVVYSSTWKRLLYRYASGGSVTYASSSTARARTTFSGRGVAIVAPVGTTRGSARVYVDGVYRATVSFRSSMNKSRVVMFSTTFAALGTHAIDVRLSGNGRVDIDAFVILR